MPTWMQGGSISTLSQQDGDNGPERLLHSGGKLSGALTFPYHKGGGCERHQYLPLKPPKAARHTPKHSPIPAPGKPAERSACCPPIRRRSSFSPHLNQPAALGPGAPRLTSGIFMAMKYICTRFRPTDILPSGEPQVFIVTPAMVFR